MDSFIYSKLNSLYKVRCSKMSPLELEQFIKSNKDNITYNMLDYNLFTSKYNSLPRKFWIDDHVFSPHITVHDKSISELLVNSKNILITAGSGFSVDSGIPTFESTEKTTPDSKLVESAIPHIGYYKLLNYVKTKNYFVFTTNVDSLFSKSGFENNKLYECHGSLDKSICVGNSHFKDSHIYKEQEVRFDNWLNNTRDILIIELGCGIAVPVIKETNKLILESRHDIKLIIVNPKHYEIGKNIYPFNKDIKEFIKLI